VRGAAVDPAVRQADATDETAVEAVIAHVQKEIARLEALSDRIMDAEVPRPRPARAERSQPRRLPPLA
jgi:hypothetical protein